MTFQIQPEIPILVVILFVTSSLLVYSLSQYHNRGQSSELLAFIMVLYWTSAWQLTAIYVNMVTVPELILAGMNFGNAVVALSFTYSLVWFSLSYAGMSHWVNKWTVGFAIASIFATTATVVVYPEFMLDANGLMTMGPMTIAGLTFNEWVVLNVSLKLPFLCLQLYGYMLFILSGVILGRYLLQNRGDIYTGQAVALGIGAGAPIVVSTVIFTGLVPPEWNPTHIAFGLSGIGFAIAMFRYRLFRVAPVGRRQLVEQLGDPVVMLNEANQVVDCNPTARELVDATAGWRGMAAADFFEPFDDPVERFLIEGAVETTLSAESTERSFTVETVQIEGQRGTQAGQLIRLTEITEQKAREQQLEEQVDQLDEFASIVSHDLQSPLSIAKSQLKRVDREANTEELTAVEDALTRMDTMIEDLLTMARNSQTDIEPVAVSLETTAKTAWAYSDVGDCSFSTSVPEALAIQADYDRLFQIFQNLYVNAADHNPTPVEVHVGLIGEDAASYEAADQIGFYVADDGVGISAEDREQLFNKGYSGTASGTGLGLAIVGDFVSAHGWEITVTESDDGGARFEIKGVERVS